MIVKCRFIYTRWVVIIGPQDYYRINMMQKRISLSGYATDVKGYKISDNTFTMINSITERNGILKWTSIIKITICRKLLIMPISCVLALYQQQLANSAFHHSGVGKWVPAPAGKAKAGVVHSVSGWTRGVQLKLWDSLRRRAIPERLRGVFTTRRYTNPRLPLPYLHLCVQYPPFVLMHVHNFILFSERTLYNK